MSFDDLPPGSRPPHLDEDVASSVGQAPSGQDAPPAAVSRRRRAKPAGTVAASSPVIQENSPDKPTRKVATRRKRDEQTSSRPKIDEDNAAANLPAVSLAQTESPAGSSRVVRGSSRAAKSPAVAHNEPLTPLAQTDIHTEPIAVTETSRNAGRRRRSASRPAPVAVSEISPIAQPEPVEPAAEALQPLGRTRRARPKKAPVPTQTDDSPTVESPQSSPAPQHSELPVQPRRRARTRGGRVAPPLSEALDTTPEGDGESTQTDPEESDEQSTGRPRRRRSRRSSARADADIPIGSALVDADPVEDVYTVPDIDKTVGAHLISRNGMPEIHIHGVFFPPVLFFGNMEEEGNQDTVVTEIARAAKAGVHIHSTIVELPCPVSEISPAFAALGSRLERLLAADPNGYVIPRVVFVPARGWKRDNPSEVAANSDGVYGDPSIASDRYWREAERSLQLLAAFIARQDWGPRVVGYHLERGEWFQPMAQGYDRCPANREAFREWLKRKYHNNDILLRAAWYNSEVQFGSAEIPELHTKPNPQRAFFEPRRERAIIDFHEYFSEITARRLISLATAIKRAAEHKALVSVCYGYTFEFGHTFSGHLALGILENSQAIDLICGPPSYRDRSPGGAASFPAPIDSASLHGKLWLSEDDTKTFLASPDQDPEDFNIRLDSRHATDQSWQRAIGRTVAHTTGIGFMDLWGEGWLDDDLLWQQIGAFTSKFRDQLRNKQQPRVPEVVALIDEKSLLHIQRGEQFLRRVTAGARDVLQRAGVSFGVYLQSDLLCDAFPLDAKLYLFLTPYRLTSDQRNAVKEKLQRGGKTLAWLYAPGSCEAQPPVGGAVEETATGVIGIAIRPQEWNSEVGSRIVDSHHAITDRLQSRDIGTRERLNPSFYVDDPEATVLAEYHGTGVPSFAVKDCGEWKSIFMGDPVLQLDLLRGICRFAGVHVWTAQGEDVVDIGNGYVTVHAAKEGQRTLRLPDFTGLYDVTESRHVADEIREHRFYMRIGDTRTFCVGSAERFISMGLPNVAPPGPGRPRAYVPVVPPLPSESERGAQQTMDESPLRPRNSDIETLEAVLNMDISDLSGVDIEVLTVEADGFEIIESEPTREPDPAAISPEAPGEATVGGRRRRRRGGRGRGRRRPDGMEDGGVTTVNSALSDSGGTSSTAMPGDSAK